MLTGTERHVRERILVEVFSGEALRNERLGILKRFWVATHDKGVHTDTGVLWD